MVDDQFGEVWVLVVRHLLQDRLSHVLGLLLGGERETRLLEREAVDVTVENGERVCGHRYREAGLPKAANHGIVVPERRRAG